MALPRLTRPRAKVSVTVDSDLLSYVDAFVEAHPGLDRSKIFDEALRTWYAEKQERAMEEQYLAAPGPGELEERAAWRRVQDAAAVRIFGVDRE